MRRTGEKGFTLVEVVMAVTIMGIIGAGATALVSSYLDSHAYATAKSGLYREGLMAMERMTDSVRRGTFLLIPNNHTQVRDILAVSGFVNDDNDYYFGDALFPRIDEDFSYDMNEDGLNGIGGIDDDGDGSVDEWSAFWGGGDDDEGTSFANEDPIDGIDNDGDGNVDEDCDGDENDDGEPGIAGMDDDGDGSVDEGGVGDGDEDGTLDEVGLIPTLFFVKSGTQNLWSKVPYTGTSRVLSRHVTSFQVTYQAPERILITLTLTGDDGESITFTEYAYPRNTFQKIGKRVR